MKIYIVRHGQTSWNKELRWQGNKDVPLDVTGISQSSKLAEKLSLYPLNKMYSSPLKRTVMSAEIIKRKKNVDIIYRDGLREIRLGQWEGCTTKEIIDRHGLLFKEWEESPTAQIGFGVENMYDLQKRAYQELCDISAKETDNFIIMAHGTWIRCLLCKLLHIPLERRMTFEVNNTGINIVECNKDENGLGFTVITLNDVSHLIGDMTKKASSMRHSLL